MEESRCVLRVSWRVLPGVKEGAVGVWDGRRGRDFDCVPDVAHEQEPPLALEISAETWVVSAEKERRDVRVQKELLSFMRNKRGGGEECERSFSFSS